MDRSAEQGAGRERLQVPRPDLEILVAIFEANRDRERRREADLILPGEIEIGDGLAVTQSTGRPLMKLVEVVVKNCWWSDGARKPLEIEPRNARPRVGSKRKASLPLSVLPKSEKCSNRPARTAVKPSNGLVSSST